MSTPADTRLRRPRRSPDARREMATELIESIAHLRLRLTEARRSNATIGLVPTMGALHAGHVRLIEEARHDCQAVAVSIFVNPLQFDREDDLRRYPRTLDADRRALRPVRCRCRVRPVRRGDVRRAARVHDRRWSPRRSSLWQVPAGPLPKRGDRGDEAPGDRSAGPRVFRRKGRPATGHHPSDGCGLERAC